MRLELPDLAELRPLLKELAAEILAESRAEQTTLPQGDGRLAYSEGEAAAMLGLEFHVLREQRRLGRITYTRGPKNRILYTKENVLMYLRENSTRETETPKPRR